MFWREVYVADGEIWTYSFLLVAGHVFGCGRLEGRRGETYLALKQYAEDIEPSQVIVLDSGNLSSFVVDLKDEKGG